MNRRVDTKILLTGPLFAAALLLSGCGSLPDLKGFSEATGDIQTGIATVGSEFSDSIPEATQCGKDSSNKPVPCRKKFQEQWKYRTDAIAAIADYSDALAQIVDAGNSGAESAERVMKSATGLLDVLKVAPLSGAITSAATKALVELAKYRALRSLDEAVDKAHGPISEVALLLKDDLGDLDMLNMEILAGIQGLIEAKDKDQVGSQMRFAQIAVRQHRALMVTDHQELGRLSVALADIRNGKSPSNDSCNIGDATKPDALCIQRIKMIDQRISETRSRLTALERDLQNLEKSYAPISEERAAATTRANKIRKAVSQLRIGLQEWINVHQKLGENVRKSLRPSARQLIATAKDLKQIVDDLRKEK